MASRPDHRETWTYDDFGRTKMHVDFKVQTAAYAYDDDPAVGGRLLAEYRFYSGATVLNGDGTIHTAAAAERTEDFYDDLGRQQRIDEYQGGSLVHWTEHGYDSITGNIASAASNEGTINYSYDPATGRLTRTYTASNDTSYQYDSLGRLWKATATKLNGQSVNAVTEYHYDEVGNL
ncbi:MAG: hypothetical protein NTU53_14345, partial [Planctomycetota bacterium]|nr:hypothetical protein [Planctomycetota bacterium]